MNSKERHERRYQRRKATREEKRRAKLDVYDNFDRVASVNALMRANFDSRKGVKWKASVARYDSHYLKNSVLMSNHLYNGSFKSEGFYSFKVIERGKLRPIHSLHYSERVVRRSACIEAVVPILSSNLIYDNGASLKGKGIGFHADRCETHLHRYFREYGDNEGYVLIIDFKGYFDHILHKPLFEILDRYIKDPRLNALCRLFISAPDADKAECDKGVGLYIGPEDSQIYAVAYPNRIDHLIKDQLRIKAYARYMDDSYLIFRKKEDAQTVKDILFMEFDKVGIVPNPKKTQIIKLSRGFTFLKTRYYLLPNGKVVRKAVHESVVRERRKLKKQKRLWEEGLMTLEQVCQSYMSWRGFILKKDSYRSVHNMDILFFSLYGVRPWMKKKRRIQYGRQNQSDSGRNHRSQIPSPGYGLHAVPAC